MYHHPPPRFFFAHLTAALTSVARKTAAGCSFISSTNAFTLAPLTQKSRYRATSPRLACKQMQKFSGIERGAPFSLREAIHGPVAPLAKLLTVLRQAAVLARGKKLAEPFIL